MIRFILTAKQVKDIMEKRNEIKQVNIEQVQNAIENGILKFSLDKTLNIIFCFVNDYENWFICGTFKNNETFKDFPTIKLAKLVTDSINNTELYGIDSKVAEYYKNFILK